MKRLIFTSLIIIIAIIVAILTLPFFISSDAVRAQLIERAKQITGREMQFSGTPKVSVSPFLGIEINDVVFRDQFNGEGSKPILQMPKLKGRLSIAAALSGEVAFSEFQFVRPVFNLKIYSTGQSSWHFPEGKVWDALAKAQKLNSEQKPDEAIDVSKLEALNIGSFSILDGIVEYENEISGGVEKFTNINASFIWNNTIAPWTFNGSSIWRGDLMQLEVNTKQPLLLMAGGISELSLDVKSEPLNFNFSGEANNVSSLYYSGDIIASSPSLRRLLNFMGRELDADSSLGQFDIKGKLSGTFAQMKVEDASVSLDGNESKGNISYISTDTGTSRLSGTLAFSKFDLAPYLRDTPSDTAIRGAGLGVLKQLDEFEMDLRISSTTVLCGPFNLENFAGGVIAKNGTLLIDIGSADYAEGNIVGSINAAINENEVSLGTNLNLTDVNSALLLPTETNAKILPAGKGNIEVQLRTTGEDKVMLTRNLTGKASIEIKDGTLIGVDLNSMKLATAENPSEEKKTAIGENAQSTNFSKFMIGVMVNRGVGWITQSTIETQDLKTNLVGKLDLHLGTLALRGRFIEKSENGLNNGTHNDIYTGSYFIGGTLTQPLWVSQNFKRQETPTTLNEQNAKELKSTN